MQVGPPSTNKPAFKFRGRQQLKRDLEHVTQEMYIRNKELAETNKILSLLGMIDNLILDSGQPLVEACNKIAEALTSASDCPVVAVFLRDQKHIDELFLAGVSAKENPKLRHLPGIHQQISLQVNDEVLKSMFEQRLIDVQDGKSSALDEVLHCSKSEIEQMLVELPIKSFYFIKLIARRKMVGTILAGYYNSIDQLTEADTILLDRVSESVGVALDNKLLAEENSRVFRQLKQTNAKLRQLDESKDEFISMASHQLRTPLTSMKGYVSLVLDGDAGKITDQQRKLLEQAFASSQRMVYLIADLLNVSRLRTGKFVIEPSPVNLADLVQDEIAQLHESAAGKSISLSYKKPEHFPVLQLDETKIRQVIMNFVDNAIYYTPEGGKISVGVSETPKSVELRVTDTGFGVPKADQHHLFTKFYRAKNAQKARPDGTGLGLFMAQKVVVAQGGAIIFNSREGEGSTFGFTFPKTLENKS
jgi:signal transduction histidine kinase